MSIALLLIPLALVLLGAAIAAFFWAVDSGQFEDLDEAASIALADDAVPPVAPGEAPVDPP
jgi:cbb3-type cytochrome oxidase maturation protein